MEFYGFSFSNADIWLMGICSPLILIIINSTLNRSHIRNNRLADASKKFREIIHTSLEGIYPDTASYLSTDEKDRITQNSINRINSAGAEFRHYLPFYYVRRFDRALSNYCKTARETYWDHEIAFNMFPSSNKKGDISPGEKFRTSVYHLLSFAKEK